MEKSINYQIEIAKLEANKFTDAQINELRAFMEEQLKKVYLDCQITIELADKECLKCVDIDQEMITTHLDILFNNYRDYIVFYKPNSDKSYVTIEELKLIK